MDPRSSSTFTSSSHSQKAVWATSGAPRAWLLRAAHGRWASRVLGANSHSGHPAPCHGQPRSTPVPRPGASVDGHRSANRERTRAKAPRLRDHGKRDDCRCRRDQARAERLDHYGVTVALDNFGTGHSSLSYLALSRPMIFRIDRSLVSPSKATRGNRLASFPLRTG